ncbi:HD domain-containing phosphohydrolase [Denitromonas iodatirespirans]|uniref:Response regulator n=1 Tax=Denitromonas iodatirespirans TaxID=2795389 RepID=A0A944DFW7_DENI1|nr:HD domain-containing phosphohydrolase [Denitromonas iodatirespirans]MBT0962058.1 response regulator [Denitromonas iodatirespirans]
MKIVIIDDTPLNLTLMQALVGKLSDCEPVPFVDPLAGLAWCQANEPDLVVVDYMMPGLDGVEFISRFRATPGRDDVPILMVTADHERQTRYDALQAGATDFLNKPVDRNEFQPRVHNMLALRRAHLATRARARSLEAEIAEATAQIHEREQETVTRLARAAEFRDPETGAHILRMAHYSALISRQQGLDGEFTDRLLHAAPMHDVGKLGIPDHILMKPGRLTPDEFDQMKRHPLIGHDILKGSTSPVIQMAAVIALTHHEKFDGSGYPHGTAGDAIPLEGRIVAVADVFDALTSARPYKPAWSLDDAAALLREGRDRHFDARCVDALFARWTEVLDIRQRFQDAHATPL